MKIYLAGPLFTVAERLYNAGLAEMLRRAGHEVFLSQDEATQTLETPEAVYKTFRVDRLGIIDADVVVAVLDGSDVDSGTAWECGYARGIGRLVYGIRTDTRSFGPAERINLMVQESCLAIVDNVADLVRALA